MLLSRDTCLIFNWTWPPSCSTFFIWCSFRVCSGCSIDSSRRFLPLGWDLDLLSWILGSLNKSLGFSDLLRSRSKPKKWCRDLRKNLQRLFVMFTAISTSRRIKPLRLIRFSSFYYLYKRWRWTSGSDSAGHYEKYSWGSRRFLPQSLSGLLMTSAMYLCLRSLARPGRHKKSEKQEN